MKRSENPIVHRLEELLARIQQRSIEPRPPKRRAQLPLSVAPNAAPRGVSPAVTQPFEIPASAAQKLALPPVAAVSAPTTQRRIDSTPTLDTSSLFRREEPPAAAIVTSPESPESPMESAADAASEATAKAPHDEVAPVEEARVSTASGEYAVIDHDDLLELEELGPADELGEGESVVEIDVDDDPRPPSGPHPVAEIEAAQAPEAARDGAASEPPISGREVVGEPRESARIAVASIDPAAEAHRSAPDVADLQRAAEAPPIVVSETANTQPDAFVALSRVTLTKRQAEPNAAPEPPPPEVAAIAAPVEAPRDADLAFEERRGEPAAEIAVAPESTPAPVTTKPSSEAPSSPRASVEPPPPLSVPPGSFDIPVTAVAPDRQRPLAPPSRPPPPPPPSMLESDPLPVVVIVHDPPPTVAQPAIAQPAMPQRIATSVHLRTQEAVGPIDAVTVAIDADVIRPGVTPEGVAALIGAARSFKPETFGALVDAALEL